MYHQTIDYFAQFAARKSDLLKKRPEAIIIGAMMAGAYVGIGIILIFSVGALADPASQKLIMGATFAIALTLVVFAGADLFTGYTMYMPLAMLKNICSLGDLIRIWLVVWIFNLVGSFLLAYIFALGGGGALIGKADTLLIHVAEYKMNSPAIKLLARSILCNWLVCLALWMAARTENDVAKCILIFWCLLAFIASGFEHSIANMTLFSISLLGEHPETVSISGMFYNLFWVTIGNTIAGVVLMAGAYWVASPATLSLSDKPSNQE